jgi:hypothetical protein
VPDSVNADNVEFVVYNLSNNPIDSFTGIHNSSNSIWYVNVNTGLLTDTSSSYIIAKYWKGVLTPDSALMESSLQYNFKVLPKPDWLANGGSYSNLSLNSTGDSVTMNAVYPLQMSDYVVPPDVKFVGGKALGFSNNGFNFNPIYSLGSSMGYVDLSAATFSCAVKVFDRLAPPFTFSVSSTNINGLTFSLNIDSGFNIGAMAQYTYARNLIDWQSPPSNFPIPGTPLTISFATAFKLDGGIGGKLRYGKDVTTQKYGLIGSVTDTTASNIATAARISASLIGGINLISKKIISAEGTLTAIGRLGVDYRFVSLPAPTHSLVAGGDLLVNGEIKLSGIGYEALKFISFGSLPDQFGNSQLWPRNDSPFVFGGNIPPFLDFAGLRLINPNNHTYQEQWFNELNYQMPDPDMDTKNFNIRTVWIEEDTVAGKQYLFMSEYDSSQCGFGAPKTIVSQTLSISNPKISSFANGNAIITWSQNRYGIADSSSLPHDSTRLDTYLDGQDIWYAVYNESLDSVVIRQNTDSTHTRAEGEASVTAGIGTEAIISWPVESAAGDTTDIYFVSVNNTSGTWTMTAAPAAITDLPGNNFKADIEYVDATHAVAVWINDPDANDSTANDQIVSYIWDGSTWSVLSPVAPVQTNVNYDEVSFDVNNGYALVAYTSDSYIDTGIVVKTVQTEIYNSGTGWSSPSILTTDSVNDLNMPTVSISDSGLVAVSYQSINRFTDSIPDQGQLNLFVNNLASYNPTWTQIGSTDLQFLCDTNTFVWQMSTSFGKGGVLYILTQESDTVAGVGINVPTDNGSVFGSQDLGMVVRNVHVDYNTLAISDAPAPCNATGIKQLSNNKLNNSVTITNYPNPASDYTIFDYTLTQGSNIKLEIFDLQGNLVDNPVNQFLNMGKYKTLYYTNKLSNGVYMYKVTMNNYTDTHKLIITK